MHRARSLSVLLGLLGLLGVGTMPVAANTDPPVTQQEVEEERRECRPLTGDELQVGPIVAGVETCEDTISLTTDTIPTASVTVAADQAALYSGPGAQYPRLAVLPKGTAMQLTGQTRNGWVAVQLTAIPLIGWVFAPYLSVTSWATPPTVSQPPVVSPPLSGGTPVSDTTPLVPTPVPALPAPDGALVLQPRPAERVTLVVQVCTGQVAGATAACLPQQGIDRVPLQVMTEAGDVLVTGITDAQGRWTGSVPRQHGTVRVVVPLLAVAQPIDLSRATAGTPLVVPLLVPAVAIPPTLG